MKPRYGVLFKFIGHEFVVSKVDGDQMIITERESGKRFRWTVGGFEKALKSRAVVIDSTMEKRQIDDALRIGRSMAQAAIERNDQKTTAQMETSFTKLLGMDPWVAKIAADEYTKTWERRRPKYPYRNLFRFKS